jgi:hypothetical protein
MQDSGFWLASGRSPTRRPASVRRFPPRSNRCRGNIAQNRVGCRMDVKGGGNQKQQRVLRRKLPAGKIAVLLKLPAGVVPPHARPVVEPLQGQVDVFVSLELHDRQATVAGGRENVEHGPIRCRKSRHLQVEAAGVEALVDGADVPDDQRFEPAFRMEPPQGLMPRPVPAARQSEPADWTSSAMSGADRPSSTRSSLLIPNTISCPFRKERASCATRVRANSSPLHRNATSAVESTATSHSGNKLSTWWIESEKRSSVDASSGQCTSRVAILPRSA